MLTKFRKLSTPWQIVVILVALWVLVGLSKIVWGLPRP